MAGYPIGLPIFKRVFTGYVAARSWADGLRGNASQEYQQNRARGSRPLYTLCSDQFVFRDACTRYWAEYHARDQYSFHPADGAVISWRFARLAVAS